MQEEFEETKEVIRAVHRRRTHKKSLKMQNGVIRARTPKKEIHEELEYTKGVIRAVHRRRIYTSSLNIQQE
jgi:hypothetical protein